MSKLIIPAIFAATLLTAGMFAFMPVEKAQTVHTTITTTVDRLRAAASFDDTVATTAGVTVIPTSTTIEKCGTVAAQVTAVGVADDVDLEIITDSAGTIAKLLDVTTAGVQAEFCAFGLNLIDKDAGVGANDDTVDLVSIWTVSAT